MTTFVFTNGFLTGLAADFASGATVLQASSVTNFPGSIAAGTVVPLTLRDAATNTIFEIVYATAVAGSNITVTRAQEGTSALNWSVGDAVFCAPTKNSIDAISTSMPNIWQAVATLTGSITFEVTDVDATPIDTDGQTIASLTITPSSATSKLFLEVYVPYFDAPEGSQVVVWFYNMTDDEFIGGTAIGGSASGSEFGSEGSSTVKAVIDSFTTAKTIKAAIGWNEAGAAPLNPILGVNQQSILTIQEIILTT